MDGQRFICQHANSLFPTVCRFSESFREKPFLSAFSVHSHSILWRRVGTVGPRRRIRGLLGQRPCPSPDRHHPSGKRSGPADKPRRARSDDPRDSQRRITADRNRSRIALHRRADSKSRHARRNGCASFAKGPFRLFRAGVVKCNPLKLACNGLGGSLTARSLACCKRSELKLLTLKRFRYPLGP